MTMYTKTVHRESEEFGKLSSAAGNLEWAGVRRTLVFIVEQIDVSKARDGGCEILISIQKELVQVK